MVDRFQGFNWVVMVQQPTNVALAPISGLSGIQTSLMNSQRNIVYLLVIVVALVFILSLVTARILSRGITKPLLELRDHAEAVSKGDTSRVIKINSNDEIEDLATALDRLLNSLSIVLQRYKKLKSGGAS